MEMDHIGRTKPKGRTSRHRKEVERPIVDISRSEDLPMRSLNGKPITRNF